MISYFFLEAILGIDLASTLFAKISLPAKFENTFNRPLVQSLHLTLGGFGPLRKAYISPSLCLVLKTMFKCKS